MSDSSATLWTVAHQTPRSMRFARQEYWGGFSKSRVWAEQVWKKPKFSVICIGIEISALKHVERLLSVSLGFGQRKIY